MELLKMRKQHSYNYFIFNLGSKKAQIYNFSAGSPVVNGEKKCLVHANRGAWQATVHGVAKS